MANSYFSFKQFTIHHGDCAMKVGTDGVLLGAWCTIPTQGKVLDIGCGTGLIALMAAQRGASEVDAVEIDPRATQQAIANVAASLWANRVTVHGEDIVAYTTRTPTRYALIVSNPPYFQSSLLPTQSERQVARHTLTLTYESLLQCATQLLAPAGRIALVFPIDVSQQLMQLATQEGLTLVRCMEVKGNAQTPPKRMLAEWSNEPHPLHEEQLTIEVARHQYSDDYIALTKDFYLHM